MARGLCLRSRRVPPGRWPGCACAGARLRRGSHALPGVGTLLRLWKMRGPARIHTGASIVVGGWRTRALFALTARTARPMAGLRLRGGAPKARLAGAPGCRGLAGALENERAGAHPRGCLDRGWEVVAAISDCRRNIQRWRTAPLGECETALHCIPEFRQVTYQGAHATRRIAPPPRRARARQRPVRPVSANRAEPRHLPVSEK